jgi:hypothetical protein
MPIEIKELHIKVTVNAPTENAATTTTAPSQQGGAGGGTAASDKEAIVAECIEQVLQILQEKRER